MQPSISGKGIFRKDAFLTQEELALKIAKAVVSECRRTLLDSYEDAGLSGLCGEGRWEAALGSLETLDLHRLVNTILNGPVEPHKSSL